MAITLPKSRNLFGSCIGLRKIAKVLVGSLTVWFLAGCTQIEIHQADGSVMVERDFGFANVSTVPGRLPQIVQSRGLGIRSGNGGVTIGWFDEETAILPPDDCRIVVWVREKLSADMVSALNSKENPVCFVGPGSTKKGMEK